MIEITEIREFTAHRVETQDNIYTRYRLCVGLL